ncbi:hypothetical protein [Paracoccus albicereus]|nr:hypothetical protein [Paracoccus albicereus]
MDGFKLDMVHHAALTGNLSRNREITRRWVEAIGNSPPIGFA